MIRLLSTLLFVALLATPALAEIRIPWWTLDGGGGRSAGASGLMLEGTIGQPDAAAGAARRLVLVGGLWGGGPPDDLFRDGFEPASGRGALPEAVIRIGHVSHEEKQHDDHERKR
jgi:hypothetical protein